MAALDLGPVLRAIGRSPGTFAVVVLEVAVGLAVVVHLLAFSSYFSRGAEVPWGFDTEVRLVSHERAGAAGASIEADAAALRSLPGVRAVAWTETPPMSAWTELPQALSVPGRPNAQIGWGLRGGPGFPEALGLEFVEGRPWRASDRTDGATPAVITRSLAQALFGPTSALGRTFRERARRLDLRVFGVVEDVISVSSFAPYPRRVFFELGTLPAWRRTELVVNVAPGARAGFAAAARAKLGGWVVVKTLGQAAARRYQSPQGGKLIMWAAMGLVIFVVLLGWLGSASFLVTERTRQIGIRRALGGQRRDIIRYFLLENGLVTGMGIAIGLPLTLLLNVALRRSLPELVIDTRFVVGGIAIFWATGLFATVVPALRAARVPPSVVSKTV